MSQTSRLTHDWELSEQCAFVASRQEYQLPVVRRPGHEFKHTSRGPTIVEHSKRIFHSIELYLGDGFCTSSVNLKALVGLGLVLTLRDGTLERGSKVMIHRSLTRLFESALLAQVSDPVGRCDGAEELQVPVVTTLTTQMVGL